jgi:hypothetical protein
MNPVQKAIFEAKWQIPSELLQECFIARTFDPVIGPQARARLPVSIDHQIRQHVVNPKVIVDTNLVGGIELTIPLASLVPNNISPWVTTYTVPKALTQGRVISRVVSMTIGQGSVMGTTNMGMQGASPLLDAASGVLSSALPIPLVSTAYIQMIGENTFLIDDNMALPNNVWLRCIVEADEDFNHISPPLWLDFAELVVYATKAYIHNKLVIEVGMAQLVGGQELGRFKEILDTYSDAAQNYKDFLAEKWRVSQLLDDPSQHRRHLRLLLGGSW